MVIILGAGIIGLFLGHELLKKGKKVKIFDSNSIKAKSTLASVGMLAPLIEAKPLERKLFNLMIESKIIQKSKKAMDALENFRLNNELAECDKCIVSSSNKNADYFF